MERLHRILERFHQAYLAAQPYAVDGVIWLWLTLAPIHAVVGAMLFLGFGDSIVGIWAAHKQKIPITSFGLRKSVPKLLGYFLSILFAFVLQQYVVPSISVVNAVAALICVTEFLSIIEKLTIITELPMLDKLKALLQPPRTPNEQSKPSVPSDPPDSKG